MRQPNSMWLPMFIETPEKNHRLRVVKVHAVQGDTNLATANAPSANHSARLVNAAGWLNTSTRDAAVDLESTSTETVQFDAPDNSGNGQQQYIFLSLDNGRLRLSPGAQVLLVAPAHSRFAHPIPMECAPLGGGLLCHLHPQTITFSMPRDAGTPQSQVGIGTTGSVGGQTNGTGTENDPCLISHIEKNPNGEVVKAWAERNESSKFCNWRNYRLQVVVTQTSNEVEGSPTILAAADFPTGDNTLPIVGPARNAQLAGGTWKIQFPVWYGTGFMSGVASPSKGGATKADGTEQLCVADETGERNPSITASLARDPLGDPKRAGLLTVKAPTDTLSTFIFSQLFLYDHNCNGQTAVQLGALNGVDKLILPDNLLLTKAGTNSSFYQFTGTNTDRVSLVIIGNDRRTPHQVRGGFIVDLSSGSGPSATKQKAFCPESKASSASSEPSAGTKSAQESLLYFDLCGLEVPAIACWNTDPKAPPTCGQVVVNTPPSGPATIAPVVVVNTPPSGPATIAADKVGNLTTPQKTATETPSAKISVRPD